MKDLSFPPEKVPGAAMHMRSYQEVMLLKNPDYHNNKVLTPVSQKYVRIF